jgi:3-dehydroquinate dehydratase-2
MQRINLLVINGPNLGHIGQRQPEIYGRQSLEDLPRLLASLSPDWAERLKLDSFQSNSQGELIDRLERARKEVQGLIINAGALTHTSLALADCLAWIALPCVEVHLSNVWSRSTQMRHNSLLAPHCLGVIAGFGVMSYALAVMALWEHIQAQD